MNLTQTETVDLHFYRVGHPANTRHHRFMLAAAALAMFLAAPKMRAENGLTATNVASFGPGISLFSAVQGTDGNFYGAVMQGFVYNQGYQGALLRVTPAGTSTTLLLFNGTNGARPFGSLAQGDDGSFYGVTEQGGAYNQGTVFQATTNGILTTLVSFNITNGASPGSGLVRGSDGNYYGTTASGGANTNINSSGQPGYGTAFRITTNGTLTLLASFDGTNGDSPGWGLTEGQDGNFYGTTTKGGDNGLGTVFRVTTDGTLTMLTSFNGTNGSSPCGGLILGRDGNFYGTTREGGTNTAVNAFGTTGYGTVFRITPDGVLTSLTSFNLADGAHPYGRLVEGTDGAFYGTTYFGGTPFAPRLALGYGTVFRVSTNGTLTRLISLDSGLQGVSPMSGLTQAADGSLYGTTQRSGPNGGGTIFHLVPAVPPRFQTAALTSGTSNMFAFTWTASPGQTYVVQQSPDLSPTNWSTYPTAPSGDIPYSPVTITATNSTMSFSLPTVSSSSRQFYRLQVVP
jgi:uncharacterized repeat protein (TIGR03803 family)